jgi:uncharacterized membrane protein
MATSTNASLLLALHQPNTASAGTALMMVGALCIERTLGILAFCKSAHNIDCKVLDAMIVCISHTFAAIICMIYSVIDIMTSFSPQGLSCFAATARRG